MKDKTLIAGDVNELKCILAFESRGYYTSIPFSGSCRYDVIVDVNGKLLRIQCKSSHLYGANRSSIEFSGTRSTTNTKKTTKYKYSKEEIDYFYTNFGQYDFLVPVDEVSTSKILRLKKPNCNQDTVNVASDYLIDNVLDSIVNGTPLKKYIDEYIISIDENTQEKKVLSLEELKNTYNSRQIRYIKEAVHMNKTAYNKRWQFKEFPEL